MCPSWPERDSTALAMPSVEQSRLRPSSQSGRRDGENWIGDSALQFGRSSQKGERCAITTVHCTVHCFVHVSLTANPQKQREMHSEKSRHSDTKWLGVGLERPRLHCHQMRGGRSSPTLQVPERVMWTSPCYFTALYVTANFTPHQLASADYRPRLTNCERGKSTRLRSGTRRERPHPLYARCVRVSWVAPASHRWVAR